MSEFAADEAPTLKMRRRPDRRRWPVAIAAATLAGLALAALAEREWPRARQPRVTFQAPSSRADEAKAFGFERAAPIVDAAPSSQPAKTLPPPRAKREPSQPDFGI